MDEVGEMSQTKPKKEIAMPVLLSALTLLLVVAAVGYVLFPNALNRTNGLSGTLLLALAERQSDRFYQYELDMATGMLERVNPAFDENIFLQNRNGTRASFIGSSSAGSGGASALQVFRATVSGSGLGNIEKLSSVQQERMRSPDISSRGDVLYTALTDPTAGDSTITTAEEWSVFLASGSGEPTLVTTGMYPHWVDDDLFIVLKNDGIHLMNVDGSRDEIVWELYEGVALSNMMLHLSENKQTIAWTAPDVGALLIAQVTSWDPLKVDGESITVHGFWPTVSPDGKYVALQTVNWDTAETDPRPRIIVYDATTLQEVGTVVDLNRFDQEYMFVSDWI
jgi:hypothetical protein